MFFKRLPLIILFLSFITLRSEFSEPTIEEGFVTFATADYFPLLRILLDSVKKFSTRPVVAFGINDDIPFSTEQYPFLIKKRIDNIKKTKADIFTLKPKIILDCGIRYGVYIEADDILTHKVDELFAIAKTVGNYPLCPIHSLDVNDQRNIMQLLGVKQKSMPYMHGHIVFAQSCLPFIEEWYNTCKKYIRKAQNFDETILNVLLWKHNVSDHLDLYDPYAKYITNYANGTLEEIYMQKYKRTILGPYMFHGYKKPSSSRQILNKLIKIAEQDGFSKE